VIDMHDPMLLEEVLLRHKRLRLWVMHAGWPRAESMMALLYAHPTVYVDVAALSAERFLPRAGYVRYVRDLVDAGFPKCIMFGSDFPDQVAGGIDAVQTIQVLSPEMKADIHCNNDESCGIAGLCGRAHIRLRTRQMARWLASSRQRLPRLQANAVCRNSTF